MAALSENGGTPLLPRSEWAGRGFSNRSHRRSAFISSRNLTLRFFIAFIAAAVSLLVTNNWCLIALPALLTAFVFDYLLSAARAAASLRLVAAAAWGAIAGLLLSVGPDWAFREAFNASPPPGIRDVWIRRHYLGGPGEHVLIIAFTPDPPALESLIAPHTVVRGAPAMERWREAGGGWSDAFDAFVGPGLTSFAQQSWQRLSPIGQPEALNLGEVNRGSLVLFRDAETGRCVALHVRF